MDLKKKYIDKLEELGVDVSELDIEEYEKASVISLFSTIEGKELNVSVAFFRDDSSNYEITVRRMVDIKDKLASLEKINDYNSKSSGITFCLEYNELYAVRTVKRFEDDIQEILSSASSLIEIILQNDIY